MSAPLSAEEQEEYTRIIDGILHASDLLTVTRKKIRQGLQDAINKDLTDQKQAIKLLIEARFDAISAEAISTPTSAAADDAKIEINGNSPSEKSEETRAEAEAEAETDADVNGDGEIQVVVHPAKKKQKRESSTEDADARLAAQLQAEEERLARGRATRGGGTAKVTKKAKSKNKNKTQRKKSEKRVRDDSDAEGSDSESGEKTKRKAGGGFQKPFNLSYALAELCGEQQLSRPQVVKKLWAHIKAHDLQDPKDKRQILCDEPMAAIFKQNKVDMFQMNKLIGNHLYPIEEE